MDYDALAAELATGRIRAVLDVFPQEPLPADSPLRRAPGVTLTPHIAGYSADVYARMGRSVVEDLLRWDRGQAPAMGVDPARFSILA